MRRVLTGVFALLLAAAGNQLPAMGEVAGATFEGERVVPNQLIVSVVEGTTPDKVTELFDDVAWSYAPISNLDPNTYLVTTNLYRSIADQIKYFQASELVEYAEPNGYVSVSEVSDDPLILNDSLWGMTSATGSVARDAWAAGYVGSNQVYVAVIDSGIDVNHPDLAANIWVNAEEVAGNGIDDDGNGFVDDINGFDFVRGDGTVFDEDENFHGTHVAGTIAAVGGNGVGVAGVSWNTRLISAKMIDAFGGASYANAIAAIDYVTMLRTQKGLDIIASNNSWGGSGYSRAMEEAIQRGGDAGIIFVAAAGNDRNNNDSDGHNPDETYPASYDCSTPDRPWDCVVSVGAHDTDGSLAFFSSYGANTVDLLAPGVDIVSTMPGGLYEAHSGTSMAAPHVTGALSICVGANRGMSAYGAIAALIDSVTIDPSLSGTVASSGRLNVLALASDCSAQATSFAGAPTFHLANATYIDRIRLDWQDSVQGEYEYEIQKSVGPAGCSSQAVWVHHAWIGPGLNSYPAIDLDEAEFHCFRTRAWRDGQSTQWSTSNVSITWTSNLPFIYGKVITQDGVPVSNIPVRWLASGSATNNAIKTVTNASGEYVLQVPNGVSGDLYVETSRYPSRSTPTSPITPWGLTAGGKLTVEQDTVVDITLPEFDLVTIKVIEADSNQPVAGATIAPTDYSFRFCKNHGANGYLPFPGAEAMNIIYGDACQEYSVGSSSHPVTDENGELTIAIVDAAMIDTYHLNLGLTYEARHPLDLARVKQQVIDVESIADSKTYTMVLPGTPSKPEQPTAMAEEGSITLNWTEPWNGGAFIDYYEVWLSLAAEGPFEQVTTGTCAGEIDPTWRSCEVTGLEAGIPYYFAIIAHNEVGYSDLSISTMAVMPATIFDFASTGTASITGTAQVGQTLTANVGTWDPAPIFDIKWLRDGVAINGATGSIYLLTEADENSQISIRVTGIKEGYNSATVTSETTSPVSARPLADLAEVGTPTISGTLEIGQTLTASPGAWDSGVNFTYRWFADDVELLGETENTLVITEFHLGLQIRVEVTGSKDGHNSAVRQSQATSQVVGPAPLIEELVLTPTPTVEGLEVEGETLVATIGDWDSGVSLSYRWLRDGNPITGATSTTYTLTEYDALRIITFEVVGAKVGYHSAARTSAEIGPIVALQPMEELPELRQQTGLQAPSIAGSPRVGSELTVVGGFSSASVAVFEYQWLKDGVPVFGATDSTYTTKTADLGSLLCLRVTSKRDGYLDLTVTSNEVGPIAAALIPTLGGGGGAPIASVPAPLISNPIPVGKKVGAVDADGNAIDVIPLLAEDKKSLELSFGSAKLSLSSSSAASFSEDGKLAIAPKTPLKISASGYQPDSTITSYLVPTSSFVASAFKIASEETIELGRATANQDGSFDFEQTIDAPAGSYLLQLSGTDKDGNALTVALETLVTGDQTMKTWAKRLPGNTEAKLYAKNIVGAGKVVFKVNGKEIAWVRAIDATDPKLRVITEGPMTGANYLVRTVKLNMGKNILEIYIDGERTTRVAYSRK